MFSLKREPWTLDQLFRHHMVHLRDMAIVEFLTYFVVGAAVFALVLYLGRKGAFRFLIRPPAPKPVRVHMEVFNSALSVVLYNGVQLAARVAVLGFGYIVTLNNPLPLWEVALSFPLVLIVHDAYFYWTHRMMHAPALYRFFHWEHHKSHAPTVFTAYSFAIPEAIVQGLFGVFYVAFFPCTFATLIFFQFIEILHNLMIHSGVDVLPRKLVVDRRWGWLAGAAHHDLHHRRARGNFGLYSRFWDRLMKTEHPDFVRIWEYIHAPGNDGQAYRLLRQRLADEAVAEDIAPQARSAPAT
ncbi:MAG TPA: sterol desaturase family protein [Caulobacteraceae bacterium]|jgi:sterol desaturase/sphingolipid hydroxylase (fatty acid hydroxylase superfamily)|nr:sterol desaturase family protein [Caulobacteraceae bacterium]